MAKKQVIDFTVFVKLMEALREKEPEGVFGFKETKTGFGTNVTNEAQGKDNVVLSVYHINGGRKEVFGHVIGPKQEIRRFLGDYERFSKIKKIDLGDKVLFNDEVITVAWVSPTQNCAAGTDNKGNGQVFFMDNEDLKAII